MYQVGRYILKQIRLGQARPCGSAAKLKITKGGRSFLTKWAHIAYYRRLKNKGSTKGTRYLSCGGGGVVFFWKGGAFYAA